MHIPTALGPSFRGTRTRGFTIVELLVSLALIIFIMSLVSTIFVLATKSFRDMKAAGDLSEQLRSAGQLVRTMIKANHFEGNVQPSDNAFWDAWNSTSGSFYPKNPTAPVYSDAQFMDPSNTFGRSGFMRIEQSSIATPEGADFYGINVAKADGLADHRLSMSVLLNGNTASDVFSAYYDPSSTVTRPAFLPNPNYSYFETASLVRRPKAEVAFFLAGPDVLDAPMTGLVSSNPSLKLYSLHMKTWLLKDSGDPAGTVVDSNLSFTPAPTTTWNDLGALSSPNKRASTQFFNTNPTTSRTSSALSPQTLILRNVISFDVQLIGKAVNPISLGTNGFFDTSAEANWTKNSATVPPTYTDIPGAWVASQWRANPKGESLDRLYISGIRITIRVYDPDNEITRQMTIIEPL